MTIDFPVEHHLELKRVSFVKFVPRNQLNCTHQTPMLRQWLLYPGSFGWISSDEAKFKSTYGDSCWIDV